MTHGDTAGSSTSRAKVTLPKRSARYGVGKAIGGCVYVHRRYEDSLGAIVAHTRAMLPPTFDYTVVKLNERKGAVSFIQSPDFDTAPEPVVGPWWRVAADGSAVFQWALADPFLYHHKWLMVADDYDGFDVDESRARSLAWIGLTAIDRSRIGRRSFWLTVVASRLSPEEPR